MHLRHIKENWNKLAATDPFWAVLSWPDKKGHGWNIEEFFDSGESEINEAINYISSITCIEYGTALDFGSGLGRLTQPLGRRFIKVIGVDISETMIEQAKEFNSQKNISFVLNTKSDLGIFSDNYFNFIYTRLTLQHIPSQLIDSYIDEFARVLKPQGVMIFAIPDRLELSRNSISGVRSLVDFINLILPDKLLNSLRYAIGYFKKAPVMEMNSKKELQVRARILKNGLQILDVSEFGKLPYGWKSIRYIVRKY